MRDKLDDIAIILVNIVACAMLAVFFDFIKQSNFLKAGKERKRTAETSENQQGNGA